MCPRRLLSRCKFLQNATGLAFGGHAQATRQGLMSAAERQTVVASKHRYQPLESSGGISQIPALDGSGLPGRFSAAQAAPPQKTTQRHQNPRKSCANNQARNRVHDDGPGETRRGDSFLQREIRRREVGQAAGKQDIAAIKKRRRIIRETCVWTFVSGWAGARRQIQADTVAVETEMSVLAVR